MSRIRSTHPQQWTDEDFVCLSFPARLLAIAVRNECDDKGIFEWKPRKLKMRLFPADNIEVEELLTELVENDQCIRYEVDGKPYGAVRNFRKYQRPKKPNDVYPITEQVRKYVGLTEPKGVTATPSTASNSPPVPHQFPTSSPLVRKSQFRWRM